MPTTWTKTNDVVTPYTEIADKSTSYTKIADDEIQWKSWGGLIRLCTEGKREDLMTEGNIDYIVISHGEDVEIWTDTPDNSTLWTKINDI